MRVRAAVSALSIVVVLAGLLVAVRATPAAAAGEPCPTNSLDESIPSSGEQRSR